MRPFLAYNRKAQCVSTWAILVLKCGSCELLIVKRAQVIQMKNCVLSPTRSVAYIQTMVMERYSITHNVSVIEFNDVTP